METNTNISSYSRTFNFSQLNDQINRFESRNFEIERRQLMQETKNKIKTIIQNELFPPLLIRELLQDDSELHDIREIRRIRFILINEFKELQNLKQSSTFLKTTWNFISSVWKDLTAPELTLDMINVLESPEMHKTLHLLPSVEKALSQFPEIKILCEQKSEIDTEKFIAAFRMLTEQQQVEILQQIDELIDPISNEYLDNPVILYPLANSPSINLTTLQQIVKTSRLPVLHPYSREPLTHFDVDLETQINANMYKIQVIDWLIEKLVNKEYDVILDSITKCLNSSPENSHKEVLTSSKEHLSELIKSEELVENSEEPFHQVTLALMTLFRMDQVLEGQQLLKMYLKELNNTYCIRDLLELIYLETRSPLLSPRGPNQGSERNSSKLKDRILDIKNSIDLKKSLLSISTPHNEKLRKNLEFRKKYILYILEKYSDMIDRTVIPLFKEFLGVSPNQTLSTTL